MERMSALDAAFYFNERVTAPLHIASVTVLEGPAPPWEELVALTEDKLRLVPRYRQRVRAVPLRLGRPVWVDDQRFDIGYHLRRTAIPSPGGPQQLRDSASRILSRRLDLSRPPWEIWAVEGLAGGRWAIIAKVHHCVVDGVGAGDLMSVLFDLEPAAGPGRDPVSWTPEPEPSRLGLVAGALRADAFEPFRLMRGRIRPGELLPFAEGLPHSIGRIAHRPAPSLSGRLGQQRLWSWVHADLDEIKTIRGAHGGTVNDVVLAAVTRGYRDLLEAQGELTDTTVVRSLVPVSVRGEGEQGVLTNRVSAVIIGLPCGDPDPIRRLFLLRQQMAEVKRTHQAVGGEALTRLAGLAPALLPAASRAAFTVARPLFETVTTNVPGPQIPLYVLGRKVVDVCPYVPIAAGVRVSIGIFSYLGRLCFGVTAGFDSKAELTTLTDGIRAGVDELVERSRPFDLRERLKNR